MLPAALGPLIMNSHISTIWIWYTLAQLITLTVHSGYHIPFFHSAEHHDFHHAYFIECFGKIGLLDYLHNTDETFQKSINGTRHRVLLTLESARERFPDKKKIK